jgi:hypothetical protein
LHFLDLQLVQRVGGEVAAIDRDMSGHDVRNCHGLLSVHPNSAALRIQLAPSI